MCMGVEYLHVFYNVCMWMSFKYAQISVCAHASHMFDIVSMFLLVLVVYICEMYLGV